jgi:twitching motility protein PilT
VSNPIYEIPVTEPASVRPPAGSAVPPTATPPSPEALAQREAQLQSTAFAQGTATPTAYPGGTAAPTGASASHAAPPAGPAIVIPMADKRPRSYDPPRPESLSSVPEPYIAVLDDGIEHKQSPLGDVDPGLLQAMQEVLLTAASDLHVSSNAAPMVRIDGALFPIEGSEVWSRTRVRTALMSLLTPTQIETFEKNLELDFAYTISANARFRVNFYQQRGAIGGAFRLIPTGIKQLHELGVPEVVARFATLPRGLVLVTGPTGSGKSTTLAALIDLVNRTRADHIVTVEDPIEFLHTNQKSLVNQREVGSDTLSFGAALKHVLRQDPDVILIGELRDLETISVALTAAETGHLVFATLHTQDASQTIDRVIDVFPSHQQGQVRAQLAATLQGVVCQTLVKRATGSGRAVATEVLVTTPAVANLIREGKTYQVPSAMQAGRELGMHTMDQHLAELVNAGMITHEAALEKVHDIESFKRLVHRPPTASDPGGFTLSDASGRF